MHFHVRHVTPADAATLAKIQTESWRAAFTGILSNDVLHQFTDMEKVTAMYGRLLTEGRGRGYIGEIDGTAHSIAYWDRARDADMKAFAEIICMHSLPQNWRKGFGGQLMDVLLADIKKAGFRKVMLWVFTDNTRARAFYEAKGFVPTNHVKSTFGTTEICYIKNTT